MDSMDSSTMPLEPSRYFFGILAAHDIPGALMFCTGMFYQNLVLMRYYKAAKEGRTFKAKTFEYFSKSHRYPVNFYVGIFATVISVGKLQYMFGTQSYLLKL